MKLRWWNISPRPIDTETLAPKLRNTENIYVYLIYNVYLKMYNIILLIYHWTSSTLQLIFRKFLSTLYKFWNFHFKICGLYSRIRFLWILYLYINIFFRFLQAANACRYWPTGRGIYHNDNKTFLIWVNEEDHMRIISMQKGGDLKAIYQRLVNVRIPQNLLINCSVTIFIAWDASFYNLKFIPQIWSIKHLRQKILIFGIAYLT